ncbi:unnamed protein product [Dibothriocephalus latus]|uniref:Uncharacterized protein n=1 Tax=Dibothriocephalus latus TaxID=60516 RepID=A0A3P7P968_DIBLA|nr:unnamed protein product [Dibothriocephalus latus]
MLLLKPSASDVVHSQLFIRTPDDWELEVSIFFSKDQWKAVLPVEVICLQTVTDDSRRPTFLRTVYLGRALIVVGPTSQPFDVENNEQRLVYGIGVIPDFADDVQNMRLSFLMRFRPPHDFYAFVELDDRLWMSQVLTGLAQNATTTITTKKTQMLPVAVPTEVVSGDVVRYEFKALTNITSDFEVSQDSFYCGIP